MKNKINLNLLKQTGINLSALVFLVACGGSSAQQVAEAEPSNTAPTLSISSKTTSVIEGMSVELNATASDKDNDTLSYKWTQTVGEKVSLLNGTTAQPSFIAPDVSADSNVTFELEVSDGKIASTVKKEISINVIDKPKVEKRHEVMPTTTAVTQNSGLVKVTYTYTKTPITQITSGLVLNVYWDSSKLDYSKVEALLTTDYIGVSSIKDDTDNKDSDTQTDKYVTLSWVNLANGNWKVPSTLPSSLFSVEMKAKEGKSGTTTLNVTSQVDSPGLTFYSQSLLINLGS